MKCDLCNIYCPSSYQYEQHIKGSKHAQRLQGKPISKGRGVCFYWEKGTCYKGNACTFLHGETRPSTTFSTETKRGFSSYCEPTSASNLITPYKAAAAKEVAEEFVADIVLCKGGHDDPDSKLAPMFRKKKPATESRFPEIYRDVFKRKKNVNLYIQEDVGVVFEFAYNTTVIEAVRTQIKGRAWNPGMKCWTCPLESLPDAIALYEHMGRGVDESLKKRAKELTQSLGSASDSIQMSVLLATPQPDDAEPGAETGSRIGSVLVKFLYDADIVASLKLLSPLQRSYDPFSKVWTIDVLALPELLEHLQPFGYTPNQKLQELAKSCSQVQELLWSALKKGDEESERNNENHQDGLEAALKELVQKVNQTKEGTKTKVDRSSCGQAKRRRLLTSAQQKWARKQSGDWDSDDDDFNDDFDNYFDDDFHSMFSTYLNTVRRERNAEPPADCDCGQPWRMVGGRHVCRYFGTFHCDGCGNRWTSAYCYKNEKQDCRSCDMANLPTETRPLDGRPPVGGGGGHHDSARCAMCRRLGYDCSL